jgi:hypothetical protein
VLFRGLGRRRFDGRTHYDLAVLATRDRTFDEQQVALGVHFDDLEIDLRDLVGTQTARHALAGEHAARRLPLTDGARRTVRKRVAVRHVLMREVVALDDARITFALRRAADVDELAHLEEIDLELGARLELRAFAFAETELVEAAARISGLVVRFGFGAAPTVTCTAL